MSFCLVELAPNAYCVRGLFVAFSHVRYRLVEDRVI